MNFPVMSLESHSAGVSITFKSQCIPRGVHDLVGEAYFSWSEVSFVGLSEVSGLSRWLSSCAIFIDSCVKPELGDLDS